jgi:tetratricopeptide (TPR) repeat protein
MEKMSKYDDFIQPFLDGELSREELDWFSKELESNAVLAEDIRLYREVENAIREQDVMDLRDQLDVIHNAIGDPSQQAIRPSRYRKVMSYAAIASLTILISLGVLLKVQHNKLTNDQIFEKHYEPYEVTMIYRSAESDYQKVLSQAMTRYEAGEYLTAINLFEDILAKDPADMASSLYSGISYMETEQYNQADLKFQKIINHNDNLFVEQAAWYLGFCYLHTGQNLEARGHFREIATSSGSYNKKAKKIMRSIK